MTGPLLSVRAALVFLFAVLSGAAAGWLTWLADEGVPRSVLAGVASAGVAIAFFDRLVAPDSGQAGATTAEGAVVGEADRRG